MMTAGQRVMVSLSVVLHISAKDSICPKGWMLSTNEKVTDLTDERFGIEKSFKFLLSIDYGITTGEIIVMPFSFFCSGDFMSNQNLPEKVLNGRGIEGMYIESNLKIFLFGKNSFRDHSDKTRGTSVRCGGEASEEAWALAWGIFLVIFGGRIL